MFNRNSVVIAADGGVAAKIVMSIREPVPNTNIRAVLWRRPTGGVEAATALQTAFIPNGLVQQCAVGLGAVPLNECDDVSVQVSWDTGGALADGIAVTVLIEGGVV